MSYAIVESGGKQYVAREGQALEVDRLPVEVGKPVEFDRILLVVDGSDVRIGTPAVQGIKVHATVTEHTKGTKVIVLPLYPQGALPEEAGPPTAVHAGHGGRHRRARRAPEAPGAHRRRPPPGPGAAAPAAKKAEAPKPKPKSAPKKK